LEDALKNLEQEYQNGLGTRRRRGMRSLMEKEKTVNFGKENDSPSTKRSSLYVDDEKMIEKEE
jgi:hypothetical protein